MVLMQNYQKLLEIPTLSVFSLHQKKTQKKLVPCFWPRKCAILVRFQPIWFLVACGLIRYAAGLGNVRFCLSFIPSGF